MKINKIIFILIISLLDLHLQAQNVIYVKEAVKKLSSKEFHGRGYVKDGDKLAAKYLQSEAQNIGLQSFKEGYLQEFTLMVNTFPDVCEVSIDGRNLVPGEDFIVRGNSPSIRGTFNIAWINKKVVEADDAMINMINNIDKSYIIAIDTTGIKHELANELIKLITKENPTKASALLMVQHRNLSYKVYKYQEKFPTIEIKAGKINPDDRQISIQSKSRFIKKYKTNNVIGYIPGAVDTFICFTAHYDHLGSMGKDCYFPGGNDNASGSAMLLDLAKKLIETKGQNHYGYLFIWFAGEETGLLGSEYFTKNPLLDLSKIKRLINFDMIGSGEDGITVVNAEKYPQIHQGLEALNNKYLLLTEVKKRGVSANSDHHPFSEKGVPSVFIYTMGNYKEYHNIDDQGEKVPFTAYNELFKLILLYIETIQANGHE